MLLRQQSRSAGGEGGPPQVRRGMLLGQDQDLRRDQGLLHVPTPRLVQYSVFCRLVIDSYHRNVFIFSIHFNVHN